MSLEREKFNPAESLDEQMQDPDARRKSWDWMKENPDQAQQVAAQYRRELLEQIKAKIFFGRKR